jgi:hypothetical protein
MTEQRVPDPIAEVLVVEWLAVAVAKDVIGELGRRAVLALKRVEDDLAHLDVALRAVGLRVLVFTEDEGLADEDESVREVDVLPLQAMSLAGSHAGEEAHGEVVAIVGSDGPQDRLHFIEGEGFDVGLADLQRLESGHRRHKAIGVRRLIEHLTQRREDAVDALVGQSRLAGTAGQFRKLGAQREHVGLRDGADLLVAERRQQMLLNRRSQDFEVGPAPFHFMVAHPLLCKLSQLRRCAIAHHTCFQRRGPGPWCPVALLWGDPYRAVWTLWHDCRESASHTRTCRYRFPIRSSPAPSGVASGSLECRQARCIRGSADPRTGYR